MQSNSIVLQIQLISHTPCKINKIWIIIISNVFLICSPRSHLRTCWTEMRIKKEIEVPAHKDSWKRLFYVVFIQITWLRISLCHCLITLFLYPHEAEEDKDILRLVPFILCVLFSRHSLILRYWSTSQNEQICFHIYRATIDSLIGCVW